MKLRFSKVKTRLVFWRRAATGSLAKAPGVSAGRAKREQGLALILVLSLIGVILALLAEVLFESELVSRAAIGERDRVRAEMCATTGVQLALFFVTLEAKVRGLKNNPALPEVARTAVEAMQKNLEGQMQGRSLAQLLNDFPIGSQGFETIENLSQLNLSKLADEKLIEALKAVPGYFVVNVSDESAKLNVNLFADRSLAKHMRNALLRVFSGDREKEYLATKDLTPERLVSNLQDYIDGDQNDSGGGGDESAVYQLAKLKYTAKNAPLESIEELHRVPGFHLDEVYGIFSPYLTVWPLQADRGQWNINKAAPELVAALTTPAEQQVNDSVIDRYEDKIASGETFSGNDKEKRDLFDFFKGGSSGDKDTDEILRWIAGFDSSVYRIVVRGVSNQVERTMEVIAIYEEKEIGAPEEAPKDPNDSGNGGVDPNADPNAAPTPSPSPGPGASQNKAPREGKIRVVYQRFI